MRKQKNFTIAVGDGKQVTVAQYQDFLRLVIERFKDPEFQKAFKEQQVMHLLPKGRRLIDEVYFKGAGSDHLPRCCR